MIREKGMNAFLEHERQQWTCPGCGRPFSVHDRNCPHCGRRNVYDKNDYRRDFQYELQQQWISNMIQGKSIVDWSSKEGITTLGVWYNSDLGGLILEAALIAPEIKLIYVVDKTNDLQLRFHYRTLNFIEDMELCDYDVDCLILCESAEFITERKMIKK